MDKEKLNFFSTIEMCCMIIAIGTAFSILGILHIAEKITITSSTISSIAISGLLFVIADFSKFPIKLLVKSTDDKSKFLKSLFKFVGFICLIASILSLIILPYTLNPTIITDKIAVGLSIIAIGFTIINIALNYYLQSSEIKEYLLNLAERAVTGAERAITSAEKNQEHAERAITLAEKLIKEKETKNKPL